MTKQQELEAKQLAELLRDYKLVGNRLLSFMNSHFELMVRDKRKAKHKDNNYDWEFDKVEVSMANNFEALDNYLKYVTTK